MASTRASREGVQGDFRVVVNSTKPVGSEAILEFKIRDLYGRESYLKMYNIVVLIVIFISKTTKNLLN